MKMFTNLQAYLMQRKHTLYILLAEITPTDITPAIYPSFWDFESKSIQNQQVADSALQM